MRVRFTPSAHFDSRELHHFRSIKYYNFSNQSFLGIDPSFAYILALLHKENLKRKKEFVLYKSLGVIPAKWPIYSVYFFGVKANWLIDGLNSLLVFIGKVRTKVGLSYDPWP